VPSVASRGPRAPRRAGVTLIELLVVLVLLGLGSAVVVPAVRGPSVTAPAEDPVGMARRLAVRRGETLRFDVGAGGRWAVVRAAAPADTVGRGGSALEPGTALTVLPTGACLPRRLADARSSWDPLDCVGGGRP
jgi:prepilin-type N-terminal cleavage/methylation domain-containing protein